MAEIALLTSEVVARMCAAKLEANRVIVVPTKITVQERSSSTEGAGAAVDDGCHGLECRMSIMTQA